MKLIPAFFVLCISIFVYSCSDAKYRLDDTELNPERLREYIPLEVGKYIIYKLDSTVFVQLGRDEEVHSYQEKHLIDAIITDNLGRTSYRILRYIRDLAGQKDWTPNGTYFVTPLTTRIETVESNQRIISLTVPIKEGYSWKGNRYLPNDLYTSIEMEGLNAWNFTIKKTGETVSLNNITFNNVITVERINEKLTPDTIKVSNNNTASIPANTSSALVTGTPTDTIFINAEAPTNPGYSLMIYNRTNQPVVLNKIIVPAKKTRLYEYDNNQWVFGSRDDQGQRKDTVLSELPYGFKSYVVDKYSKDVGLIYSEFVLWTSQPSFADTSTYKIGYDVKRQILEHN